MLTNENDVHECEGRLLIHSWVAGEETATVLVIALTARVNRLGRMGAARWQLVVCRTGQLHQAVLPTQLLRLV